MGERQRQHLNFIGGWKRDYDREREREREREGERQRDAASKLHHLNSKI